MCQAISFSEAMDQCGARSRAILLGNGFSIAQGGGNFGYANLLAQSGLPDEHSIRRVFEELGTVDFEVVMHALEHASRVERAYGFEERERLFRDHASLVRESLINAIRTVHPGNRFEVPAAQLAACGRFLRNFETIFSLNYDLLLYWTLLKARIHNDGFGLGDEVAGFRTFQPDAHCTTYYLHGALHLFRGRNRETTKRVLTNHTIIDGIAETIRTRRTLPMIVAEGTSSQKMDRIDASPYLREGLAQLSSMRGAMFIYGHSAAPNDAHIYDTLFSSQVEQVYFCVYRPNNGYLEIRERMAALQARRDDIEVFFVDAESASVWVSQAPGE